MAKPNYSFEKRQRELKKSKQQEEKRQEKIARKAAAENEANPARDGAAPDQATPDDSGKNEYPVRLRRRQPIPVKSAPCVSTRPINNLH